MTGEKKKDTVREKPFTYEDYAKLDDGHRYELVDGVLELMSPSPSSQHQLISREIFYKLTDCCGEDYVIFYAPIDLILSETVVRQPDLLMIHRNRFTDIVRKQGIIGPPDLVVEILSPSTVKRDKVSKLHTYANFLIPEYWVVDPQNQYIEQYVLKGSAYTLPTIFAGDEKLHSHHLQCISLSINEVISSIPKIPDN